MSAEARTITQAAGRSAAGRTATGRDAAGGKAAAGELAGGDASGLDGVAQSAGRPGALTGALAAAPVRSLTRDFLAWIASAPRTYAEVMEAWQTSCPRLSIWEDALADGLVRLGRSGEAATGRVVVTLTARGRAVLDGRA